MKFKYCGSFLDDTWSSTLGSFILKDSLQVEVVHDICSFNYSIKNIVSSRNLLQVVKTVPGLQLWDKSCCD